MRYEKGLVSVIIPTYRRAETIKRAIDSVLSQSYKKIECIVINDNDPNDEYSCRLKQELKMYINNNEIIFLQQPQHRNGAAARNYGICHSRGEYIALLDDDDWWKPEKIEKQIDFITKQGNECGAVSTLIEIYKSGYIIRKTLPYKDGKIYKEILGREIDVTTCSVLIKRSCLDDTGYFDENLRRHQEVQLFSFLAYRYEIKLLPEYLTCYGIEDAGNRPKSDELEKVKKDFFHSVKPIMRTLSRSEQKSIVALHRMEIAYREISEKHYKAAFFSIVKILKSPRTLGKAMKRILRRAKEYKF